MVGSVDSSSKNHGEQALKNMLESSSLGRNSETIIEMHDIAAYYCGWSMIPRQPRSDDTLHPIDNRNFQPTCKQFNNEDKRQYRRNDMPCQTAKGTSAKDLPLPQTIFSQPLSAYNIPLIKRILSIFYQQSTFRQREPRISLLHKLARVEQARTDKVRDAVAQLLRLDIPITRSAVKAGPHDEDVDGEFTGVEEGTDCEVCLRALPPESFPQQDLASKCEHKAHMCTSCLEQAAVANVESNPWDNIPCPYSSCERMLEPSIVMNYNNYIEKLEIRNLPNFQWCLNPKCVSGQVHNDGPKYLRVICHACQSESCFLHQIPRGEGKKCTACDNAVSRHEGRVEALTITKPCPRCKVLTIMGPINCGRARCKYQIISDLMVCILRCKYDWKRFSAGR
ncbi:putative ring finger protein [Botrytis fragariae]|uniref:Putative ring finger protein n=1 Tax=Botrytis fragariae TaxID=1964551 RepID=A0A8H6ART5_9HELO|nr:putative ring finger protein [Botrytis fragariae]KAF5872240.1 putative ring finger protein [Botrytis fragariae]